MAMISNNSSKEEAIKLLLKMGQDPLDFADELDLSDSEIEEIVKKYKSPQDNKEEVIESKEEQRKTIFINRRSSAWTKKKTSHICMLASMGFKIATVSRMVKEPETEVIKVISLNQERIKRLYNIAKEKKNKVSKYPLIERTKIKHANDHLLLTRILFSEAKSQSRKTKEAIAQVIINRTKSKRYPKTISEVITQLNKFSSLYGKIWQKSENPDKLNAIDKRSYFECADVATMAIKGAIDNTIGNATLYHDAGIRAPWNTKWTMKVGRIGEFYFYEEQ